MKGSLASQALMKAPNSTKPSSLPIDITRLFESLALPGEVILRSMPAIVCDQALGFNGTFDLPLLEPFCPVHFLNSRSIYWRGVDIDSSGLVIIHRTEADIYIEKMAHYSAIGQ
jgi:hypothetical protein